MINFIVVHAHELDKKAKPTGQVYPRAINLARVEDIQPVADHDDGIVITYIGGETITADGKMHEVMSAIAKLPTVDIAQLGSIVKIEQ